MVSNVVFNMVFHKFLSEFHVVLYDFGCGAEFFTCPVFSNIMIFWNFRVLVGRWEKNKTQERKRRDPQKLEVEKTKTKTAQKVRIQKRISLQSKSRRKRKGRGSEKLEVKSINQNEETPKS